MNQQEMEHEMRCMSFNIKNGYDNDGVDGWQSRAAMVAGMIRFHRPDVAGLQEVLYNQLEDLERLLPEYGFIGVGRDDGEKAGEFMNILYRKQRLELLDSGTFWLSEQPDKPGSMGWDAACARTVTWAKFKDQRDGAEFLHVNTHFDHMGVVAVEQSAHLLVERVTQLAGALPVMITGDFNCTSESVPYRIICQREEQRIPLKDASVVAEYGHFGMNFTFHDFNRTLMASRMFPEQYHHDDMSEWEYPSPIDFIFVNDQVKVQSFGILADHQAGKFPSDHMPIVADVAWKLRG